MVEAEICAPNIAAREKAPRSASHPSTVKVALLQELTRGEGYGLDLIERLKERVDNDWAFHEGSVYPALRALEREGLAASRRGTPRPERGGRSRIYYSLTQDGYRVASQQYNAFARLFGWEDDSGGREPHLRALSPGSI